ncbi:MAG: hypothetical protein J6W16_01960 [Methanobrevibacter sp.]|nr:hypothetical protein [Methanobrevibacter sp.]
MKFANIDIEASFKSLVLWDRISKDDFNLIMKCKNLYEQYKSYTGRNVHEVNGAAGSILNGIDHFLFSFTEDFINKKFDVDGLNATYVSEGGWENHTRKFLVDQAIPQALKALTDQ